MTSVGNFALIILVARRTTSDDFGAFSIALSLGVLVLAVAQAGIGEAVVLRGSRSGDVDVPGVMTSALVIGLGGALVLAVSAIAATGHAVSPWLWIFAVATVGVVIADTARFAFSARGQTAYALLVDTVWTVTFLGSTFLTLAVDSARVSGTFVVSVWAGSAYIGAGVAMVTLGARLSLRRALEWFREHAAISRHTVVGDLAIASSTQVGIVALGAISDPSGAGALRGVSTLYGPLNVLFSAGRVALLPELVRAERSRSIRAWMRRGAFGLSALVFAWTATLAWWWPGLGAALLGDSWVMARDLVPLIGVQYVALVWYQVGLLHLRAANATAEAMRVRVLQAGLAVACLVIGALIDGAVGAAAGLAAATVLSTLWCLFSAQGHRLEARQRVSL